MRTHASVLRISGDRAKLKHERLDFPKTHLLVLGGRGLPLSEASWHQVVSVGLHPLLKPLYFRSISPEIGYLVYLLRFQDTHP